MKNLDSAANVSEYSAAEKRFLKITFYTICSLFLLIFAGAVVRSTGSGMGCPDWPKCFNQWVPPTQESQIVSDYQQVYVEKRIAKNNRFANLLTSVGFDELALQVKNDKSILKTEEFNVWKTYTEYVNRLIGALTGFLMLAMTLSAFAIRKNFFVVFLLSVLSLVLVVIQAWIGSWVVSTNLLSWVITVHMVLALIILALILIAYSKVYYRKLQVSTFSVKKLQTAEWIAWVCLLITMLQVVFGTELRESIDKYSAFWNNTNRESYTNLSGSIFSIHKSFSSLVMLITLFCSWFIVDQFGVVKGLRNFAIASSVFLAIQVLTGVVLANFALPPVFQALHLVIASFLVASQVMQVVMLSIYKKGISLELIK